MSRRWIRCDCGYAWALSENRKHKAQRAHVCPKCKKLVSAMREKHGKPPFAVTCPKCGYDWIPRPNSAGKPRRCPRCQSRVSIRRARVRR